MGPVPEDIHRQPFAEGVHDAGAHAVQTAGVGVILIAEFAARVQLGENDLHAGDAQIGMQIHGHAAAVIPHGSRAVLMQRDRHLGGITAHELVNGVVHDLPQQVVKPLAAGGSYIHAGPDADRFQTFQHLDTVRIITLPHGNTSITYFYILL